MSSEWKQFSYEQFYNVPLYMMIDDGLSNSACRAMLQSDAKEDVHVYNKKYNNEFNKMRKKEKEKEFVIESMGNDAQEDGVKNVPIRGMVLDAVGIFDPTMGKDELENIRKKGWQFDLPLEITADETKQILDNVEHCVVGLVEHMSLSQTIFEFHFPWLQFDLFNKPTKLKMKLYNDMETLDDLLPWIKDLILQANQCDMLLYNHMLEIFESEMYIVYNNAFQE